MVEPNPNNVDLLRYNTSFLSRTEIIQAALSAQEGNAQFELAGSNTSRLQSVPGHAPTTQTITVPCKRLRDVIPEHWDMNHTWLKLDIEGAEYEVLRDMLDTDLRPHALSLEIHEYPTAGGADLVRDLENAGYRVDILAHGDDANTCRQAAAIYARSAA